MKNIKKISDWKSNIENMEVFLEGGGGESHENDPASITLQMIKANLEYNYFFYQFTF